ncbi:DNA glycosylase AlkZ-like family protein [Nocardioides nanhaiensis]|uniref:Winged helix-turn-helix domain-containing protein n=1 Tax=Nocardioides nanhaiensis TaxID=1476871 RepID=A0ABP8VPH8_9ACTN
MPPVRLTTRQARRLCVRAQLLDRPRPTDLLAVVRHLTLLQHDPTDAVAPSADLVLFSRLGPGYDPAELREALDTQQLVQLRGDVRPAEDLVLFRAEMALWPGPEPWRPWQEQLVAWVEVNAPFRHDVLAALRSDGPLPAAELPDTCVEPWASSGWNNDRNLNRMLDLLVQRGEVAVADGWGRDRRYDLAERVYPDVAPVPFEEAARERDRRRLASLGVAHERAPVANGQRMAVGDVGLPAEVDGIGGWRVDPVLAERVDEPFPGRCALLSPFDRLVYDRKRMAELLDFDYVLEMYKPAAKRRWGYYALPVLDGDQLVGKLDATADRRDGVLRVHALHRDGDWSAARESRVRREVAHLAAWLGLEVDGL